MNILIVVPRFHSNLSGLDRILSKAGHKILFLCESKGPSERSSSSTIVYVNPGESALQSLNKLVDDFEPQITILRESITGFNDLWVRASTAGSNCIAIDQGPAHIGFGEFFRSPQRVFRFLGRHLIKIIVLRNYRRMTPVARWGKGWEIPVSRSSYFPLPISVPYNSLRTPAENQGRIRIICVAKHGQARKRVHWLLRAQVEIGPTIEIVLAGSRSTTDAMRNNFTRILAHVNSNRELGFSVTVKSDLSEVEMFQEYAMSDLFVLPASKEPFSVSVLEALGVGLPVLIADTNGASSYVQAKINGLLFKSASYRDFRRGLEDLCKSRTTLRWLGENAKKSMAINSGGQHLISTLNNIGRQRSHK